MKNDTPSKCPSTYPHVADAEAFAVVAGTPDQPEVVYLDKPTPVTDELLALAGPVAPTEIFRFTAPCAQAKCQHFDTSNSRCKLVERVVDLMPEAVEKLPPCPIRAHCVWFEQEGKAACLRCPQLASSEQQPSETYVLTALPDE